ncbi:MAG: STAS/SEC14 domain-containing protein [Salinimicrobium sp.]
MIKIEEKENIIYSIAKKELHDEDYGRLVPLLKEKVKKFGMIRWYFEMQNFEGWSLSAMWQDLKFDVKYAENIEKVAMVGDKTWEEKITRLMKPFTSAEIKFFNLEEKEQAKAWISKP